MNSITCALNGTQGVLHAAPCIRFYGNLGAWVAIGPEPRFLPNGKRPDIYRFAALVATDRHDGKACALVQFSLS